MLITNSSGIIIRHKVVFLTPYRDSIFSEGDSSEIELPEQEPTGAALAVVRRRRGSGAEAMATTKMGCPEYKESSGGGCAAGAARWRRGDSRRRPAVGVKGGRRRRVESERN